MSMDRLQKQRFEIKYVISEARAVALRQYLRAYLQPDEFAATCANHTYPVHSLYLDSPDLSTFQAVQSGEKNRFKLRIRYYHHADATVFLEIKRRTNDVIQKVRARVHREHVRPLLAGRSPQPRHLVRADEREFEALREFCDLARRIDATPRSHVGYQREAWMSPINNHLRITFDRAVQCEPDFSHALPTEFSGAVTPFGRQVILELKFVDKLPGWCLEMVRALGLVRGGAPKYAQGIVSLGEHRVSNQGVALKHRASAPAVRGSEPTTLTAPWTKPTLA